MDLESLKKTANVVRCDVLEMIYLAKSGHPAGSLGMADIFVYLYFEIIKNDVKKVGDSKRDFVFLSNGHICPVLYSTLARKGYFPVSRLKTLRKLGSSLQGHPHYGALKGVENSGGPLGQGISQAVGLASCLKRDGKSNRVFCFVGDGELEEGQCWEALMYGAKEKLDNLIMIVDKNDIQIDGNPRDVAGLSNLARKISSFGWSVIEFDGNNFSQIRDAFKHGLAVKDKPVCLLAKTISGKGVSFMEGDYRWHGKAPKKEEFEKGMKELMGDM